MNVTGGTTDVTTYFVLRLAATGVEATGLTIANMDLQYTRTGTAPTAKVDATALAAADTAHTDNYGFEVDATDQPGLYRIDWPDAAFAAGVRQVILTVKCATCFTEHLAVDIDSPVNLTNILGHLLTQTGTQLADGFQTFFDVASPTTHKAITGVALAADQAVNVTKISGDATAADTLELFVEALDQATGQLDAGSFSTGTLATAPTNFEDMSITDTTGLVALAATQKVDVETIKTQAVTCAAGVTVLASVGTAATSTAQTGDTYALANGANGFAALMASRVIHSGTAVTAAAGTIQLAAAAAFANDELNGSLVLITGGTGIGQVRRIWDYVGSTDTASIEPNWTTTPSGTITYVILPADSLWDVVRANHATVGSFGEISTTAAVAAAVWDLDATAHQTQGTFGQAIGDPVSDSNTIYKATVTDAGLATVGLDVVEVLTRVPDATPGAVNGLLVAPTTANTGLVDVTRWNGTAVHTPATAGLPVVQLHGTGSAGVDAPTNFEDLSVTDTTGLVKPDMANASGNYAGTVALVTSLTNAPGDSTGVTELLTRITDSTVRTGSVHADAGNTASSFQTHLTEADDYWNNCLILITSGALIDQVKEIGDFANTGGIITLKSGEAFTGIPADNVTFAIINR
jgi:hypothetical protein